MAAHGNVISQCTALWATRQQIGFQGIVGSAAGQHDRFVYPNVIIELSEFVKP
jgi:hypothetical protein